jgi:predicted small metal-binding protein
MLLDVPLQDLIKHLVRGQTVEEVLQKAREHAKEHGIRELTPELIELVKANIRDA